MELLRMFREEFGDMSFHLEIDPALLIAECGLRIADCGTGTNRPLTVLGELAAPYSAESRGDGLQSKDRRVREPPSPGSGVPPQAPYLGDRPVNEQPCFALRSTQDKSSRLGGQGRGYRKGENSASAVSVSPGRGPNSTG